MPKFLVEIPIRVTREKQFVVDHEATHERTIKFHIEAEDEQDASDFLGLLLMNELDADETDDIEPVLS